MQGKLNVKTENYMSWEGQARVGGVYVEKQIFGCCLSACFNLEMEMVSVSKFITLQVVHEEKRHACSHLEGKFGVK